jgi:hypothetical protein
LGVASQAPSPTAKAGRCVEGTVVPNQVASTRRRRVFTRALAPESSDRMTWRPSAAVCSSLSGKWRTRPLGSSRSRITRWK